MTKERIEINKVVSHNSQVWDQYVKNQCEWSRPVSAELIEKAKNGDWEVHITRRPLANDWLPKDIKGKNILCLAAAGGQQAPVLAAAGANVTVFDASKKQLEQDLKVAKRDSLVLETIQGDMRDLSAFNDYSFDYIVHPISNLYVPCLKNVWQECYRVLKKGGVLLASFYNPVLFIFERDQSLESQSLLKPKYKLPYSDVISLGAQADEDKLNSGEAITFGHTLSDQIGQQISAGFVIAGFYEDDHPSSPRFLIERYMQGMIATKAVKLE
ncbi:class I SAM-dependent methyltransferase [Piscirickettsia litoralis]|uniref:Methyltransferase n=1 Tax=Piscirickettsia litoralis TaxID=1891921 RepID=A0ABX3A4W2_9GAMM|nr:class I SAM-dependent methyltransferase [Piscirickettsia litoralis]ODN43902.1 methyltransferase [Piscirickettsia litoralis]